MPRDVTPRTWAPALLAVAILVALAGVAVAIVQPGDLGDEDVNEEQVLTDGIVLRLEDLPADQGWGVSPTEGDEDDDDGTEAPEGCQAFAAVFGGDFDEQLSGETANSESPSFQRGDLGADSAVPPIILTGLASAFADTAAAEAPLAILRDPAAGQCIIDTVEQSFNEEVATGGGDGGPPLTLVNPVVDVRAGAGGGDDSLRLVMAGSFGVPGVIELPFQFDLHLVRVGRVVVGLALFAVNSAPPEDLSAALLQTMVSRVP